MVRARAEPAGFGHSTLDLGCVASPTDGCRHVRVGPRARRPNDGGYVLDGFQTHLGQWSREKLRQVPPAKFGEMFYAAVEQDAWLLYVHGGALGVLVGAAHILVFGT
jgi:hypothetical protein